ncbi:MAG: cbb3-type cytochrome c oxidase subunit I, partial [Gemmatimonadota bacterium]|nr:cbb3-type cytochrome c oxidase subunit I [Gemmatimonadota bacterium]
INASYSINEIVHNTAWIPGHFHMTVGTAVALTIMGVAYWLVPWLQDRALWGRKLAVAQSWIYFVGVLIFARGMISGGLEGMPRRTFMYGATYSKPSWELAGLLTGIGGTLMFVSVVIFFLVMAMTMLFGRREEHGDLPITETVIGPASEGWEMHLDRFKLWVAVTVVLILIAYGPFLVSYLPPELNSPGFKLF